VSSALLGVVMLLQAGAAAPHPPDRWFGADKVKHFLTSFFVQSFAYSATRATGAGHSPSIAAASAATAVVGIGKEVYDRRSYGVFSYRDLTWDAAGAGLATVMLARTVR
jgi:putative lipoprotein